MTAPLVILGAGDLAREVFAACLEPHASWGSYRPLAFIDDDPSRVGSSLYETPIWSWQELKEHASQDLRFICAVGSSEGRRAMIARLLDERQGVEFATVVHKSAVIMPQAILGSGSYVAANATLAISSQVGEHVVINQNVSIGHDCEIGARCIVSPGCVLSGRTQVGSDTFLGSGSVTYPGAQIGEGCTVSAQGVVARRLKDGKKAITKPSMMIL